MSFDYRLVAQKVAENWIDAVGCFGILQPHDRRRICIIAEEAVDFLGDDTQKSKADVCLNEGSVMQFFLGKENKEVLVNK